MLCSSATTIVFGVQVIGAYQVTPKTKKKRKTGALKTSTKALLRCIMSRTPVSYSTSTARAARSASQSRKSASCASVNANASGRAATAAATDVFAALAAVASSTAVAKHDRAPGMAFDAGLPGTTGDAGGNTTTAHV